MIIRVYFSAESQPIYAIMCLIRTAWGPYTTPQFAWSTEKKLIVGLVWACQASKPISWMEHSQDSPNSQITTLPDIKWHFAWDLQGSESGRSPEIPNKWALIWIISYASLTNGSKAVQKPCACCSHDCGCGPYMPCLHRERYWKTVRALQSNGRCIISVILICFLLSFGFLLQSYVRCIANNFWLVIYSVTFSL